MKTLSHVTGSPQQTTRRPRKIGNLPGSSRRRIRGAAHNTKAVGARQADPSRSRAQGTLRKAGQDLGFVEVKTADFSDEAISNLYRGAAHAGCDLNSFLSAVLLISMNEKKIGAHMKLFTGLNHRERGIVSRYLKWLERLRRELNGKPLPHFEEERKAAKRIGVSLNELIREGMRRVMAEFKELGGVRFGKGVEA